MRILPTKSRRKLAGIDVERNYVNVALCILTFNQLVVGAARGSQPVDVQVVTQLLAVRSQQSLILDRLVRQRVVHILRLDLVMLCTSQLLQVSAMSLTDSRDKIVL